MTSSYWSVSRSAYSDQTILGSLHCRWSISQRGKYFTLFINKGLAEEVTNCVFKMEYVLYDATPNYLKDITSSYVSVSLF